MAYIMGSAFSGLWREKWINLLSALTIAAGLFITTVALVTFYNMELTTKRLPDRFSMAVFLDKGLSEEDVQGIIKDVRGNAGVRNVKYISEEAALRELRGVLKDADYILEGMDSNPLPASLELKLGETFLTGPSVETMAASLKGVKGVSDVRYGRKFLQTLQSIKRDSEAIGLLFVGILCAGTVFVCYSTVKILFYRKKEEVETLKFLGATKGFIRAPFVIEGSVIGLLGGFISMAGMLLSYYVLFGKLAAGLPLLKALAMPGWLLFSAPPAGMVVGMVGAVIATGRIRFQ